MSAVFKRGSARIQANLTPMIDVTFLLIVFFVLVSQIVEVENVKLQLPAPEDPATELPDDEQRVVINVVPAQPATTGRAIEYRVGSRRFAAGEEGVDALADHVMRLYSGNPTLRINLRADRDTQYEWIEPVLRAISIAAARTGESGITARVNLVVVKED
ncbi:MAG: biopolymer transporter ExbD [Phycisphaerales bacterium]|nr:MAG: biopolymer transporter ExbD [Phycisphaerales bacterium]